MKQPTTPPAAPPAKPMSHAVREEVLLSLVRNSMDAIVSADGVIDYWNPAAERLYGYTAAEAIGQPSTLNIPSDKLPEFEEMRLRLERGERIEQFATQRLRKDGTLVDVEMTVFPVMDEGGKLAATSVISHDMTEQMRLAREVEETAELKAHFLATMSHEIRTPLSAIIGTAELQMLSTMTSDQRRRLKVIQSSGELLLTIVDDILDFEKLTAGKLLIEKIDFDLNEVVEGVIETFAALVRNKKLGLASFLDPGIPIRLRGSSKRLRQVLNNLLSNAVKFTPTGEIVLKIRKIDETADEVATCFEVHDPGIGISPEAKLHLFQPFVQAERSTSRRFGGTGLGLAISKQLVEQMRGTIEFESELGKGSIFHFNLSFEKAAPIARSAANDSIDADLRAIRAMLVGDNAIGHGIMAQQLAAWGIETRSVASAEAAFIELRSGRAHHLKYPVVLLDHESSSLARVIKTDPRLKDIKVIMMTSDPGANYSTDVVDAWIVKPVSPSRLRNAMEQLLADREPRLVDSLPPVQANNLPHAWRNRIRVLVVEDNLTNQALIREQLGILGYTAHIVSDAPGAFRALSHSEYDVILMDCELPGMSGYEATAEIRRRGGNKAPLRIIALTAHVTDNQKKRCFDAGMDGYLSKPANLQNLADTLDAGHHDEAIGAGNVHPDASEQAGAELDAAALAAIDELSQATGRNVFRDLVDTFLSDLPSRIKLLTTALESSNMKQLAAVAHPLKGASAIVGARRFSDICAAVEAYARDGKMPQADSLTRELLDAAKILPTTLTRSATYK
jgi:two-component system, sensor histidine kinase and response regulator